MPVGPVPQRLSHRQPRSSGQSDRNGGEMKLNLTARAARWSAAHWKTAALAWLAFVAVAVVAGNLTGKVGLTDSEQSTGETARAESILEHAGFTQPAGESVLVQNRHASASNPAFAGTVHHVVERLRAQPQ